MSIDFVSLGEQSVPGVPLRCVPLAAPHAGALYRRRLEAVRSSTADFLCFVDGGDDVLAPDFVPACHALLERMLDEQVSIGYMAETIHGAPGRTGPFTLREYMRSPTLVHHGVVCDVAALRAIDWPAGCMHWEAIAYGTLAQRGFVFDPVAHYDWRPTSGGASRWPSTTRALVNSRRWLNGLPPVTVQGDL